MSDSNNNDKVTLLVGGAAIGAILLATAFANVGAPETTEHIIDTVKVRQNVDAGPQTAYATKSIIDKAGNEYICDDFMESASDKFCYQFVPGSTVVADIVDTYGQPWAIKGVVEVLEP